MRACPRNLHVCHIAESAPHATTATSSQDMQRNSAIDQGQIAQKSKPLCPVQADAFLLLDRT